MLEKLQQTSLQWRNKPFLRKVSSRTKEQISMSITPKFTKYIIPRNPNLLNRNLFERKKQQPNDKKIMTPLIKHKSGTWNSSFIKIESCCYQSDYLLFGFLRDQQKEKKSKWLILFPKKQQNWQISLKNTTVLRKIFLAPLVQNIFPFFLFPSTDEFLKLLMLPPPSLPPPPPPPKKKTINFSLTA